MPGKTATLLGAMLFATLAIADEPVIFWASSPVTQTIGPPGYLSPRSGIQAAAG